MRTYRDPEDLGGLFSGFDPETGTYDLSSWAYETEDGGSGRSRRARRRARRTARPATSTAAAARRCRTPRSERDETLQHPRTVFQILKRHYARYTPEMVREVCGISPDDFAYLAQVGHRELRAGPHHLLRLRRRLDPAHPGRAVHPHRGDPAVAAGQHGPPRRRHHGAARARQHPGLDRHPDPVQPAARVPADAHGRPARHLSEYLDAIASKKQKGFWAAADTYVVSLLKAWWGDAARAENNWAYDYLPRLSGPHGTYQTVSDMLEDKVEGYFLLGQNPAVGSANGRMQRLGMAHLKWLVVRDLNLIESATWWKDGPEIASGELRTQDIATEVFFLPAASHVEKAGSLHPDPAPAAVAREGGRPAGPVPERAGLLLRARASESASGWRTRPTSGTGRCST